MNLAMSSFQQPFALNTNVDDWTPVSKKSNKKPVQTPLKPVKMPIEPVKMPSKPIETTTAQVESVQIPSNEELGVSSNQAVDATKVIAGADDASVTSNSSRPNKPREPRKATGIYVNLGPEWKKFVRGLLPNNLVGGKAVRDETILDEIGKIKSKPEISNLEFKKIVCMIFHQAIKTDRHTLIERIIRQWSVAKYNMIELIDSTYDGCKPMTQACWSGSMFCIRTIISADPTGQILYTVHPTKGETILQTLAAGKSYALGKDPQSALFIADKFDKCERFIRDAMAAVKAKADAAASETATESVKLGGGSTLNPANVAQIESIKSAGGNTVTEFSLKLVELFMSDQAAMGEYFDAIKSLVDKEIVDQIVTNLANEGIDLV